MTDTSRISPPQDIVKLLQQLGAAPSYFSPSSRYKDVPLAKMERTDNEPVVYLTRRFVPKPERFFLLQEHLVKEGDKLDNIANQYLGDPERFWQICDANRTLMPQELTANPGDKIKITLPEGIAGTTNA